MTDSFDLYGSPGATPVVISVPHAGRAYPAGIATQLAVPLARARALEDRHADALATGAAGRHAVIVAHVPRLLIDLNRAETDYDPATLRGATRGGARPSFRARGGLGLVPDRLAGVGRLWREPVDAAAMMHRIATVHRPYHAALDRLLAAARRRHGRAVLIDLHSMPTLAGPEPADIVIGDLHGRSAHAETVDSVHKLLAERGFRTARNAPYAGGYLVERHARRAHGVEAFQIEIDRRLYLDSRHDMPGSGAARIAAVIAALADQLAQGAAPLAIAAE